MVGKVNGLAVTLCTVMNSFQTSADISEGSSESSVLNVNEFVVMIIAEGYTDALTDLYLSFNDPLCILQSL